MSSLDILMQTSGELGGAKVLQTLGLHSGEISQRKAQRVYGKWFNDAVADNRLHPIRLGDGNKPTRYYSIIDILKLREREAAYAVIIDK